MRVISQNRDIDIDYSDTQFYIGEDQINKTTFYKIFAKSHKFTHSYCMATYTNKDEAENALIGLSSTYSRSIMWIIKDKKGVLIECDTLDEIEKDKPFEIEGIQEIQNTVYYFPQVVKTH